MGAPPDSVIVVGCESAAGGRSENEDRCAARHLDPTNSLWGLRGVIVVADGLGGHEQGEIAAHIAVETALEFLAARPEDHEQFEADFLGAGPEELLRRMVATANERIYEWAVREEVVGNMGTTLTATVFTESDAVTANVGDSAAFAVTERGITCLTHDDSLAGRQVRDGALSEEEAAESPLRGQLTQAVGAASTVEAHISKVALEPGSVFVACTDGITDVVKPSAIQGVAHVETAPEQICETLIAMAVQGQTTDNVTVAAAYVRPERGAARPSHDADSGAERREPEVPPALDHPSGRNADAGPATGAADRPRPARASERSSRLTTLVAVCLMGLVVGLLIGKVLFPSRRPDRSYQPSEPSGAKARASGPEPEAAPEPEPPAVAPPAVTPATPGGFRVGITYEDGMLVARPSEAVGFQCYPYADNTAVMSPAETGPEGEARFSLPQAPPDTWRGRSVVLDVERPGGGRLNVSVEPAETNVYVDRRPYSDESLDSIAVEGSTARLGVYFPPSGGAGSYAVVVPELPVEPSE